MARLEWAVVCDHAYFDRAQQLCIVSITREFAAPRLPLVVPHMMFVGKLTDLQMIDQVEVTVGVITPDGAILCADMDSDNLAIQLAREYVVVTMRGVPLTQAGTYSFCLQIGDQPALTIDVPVKEMGAAELPALVH